MMVKSKSAAGFTLLEAIVALSILSAGTIALYSWYGTVMIGLQRAQDRVEIIEFSKNVESHLSMLNLQNEGNGEYESNGLTARWSAALIEPKKEGKNLSGMLGHYRLGLYDIEVEIYNREDRHLDTLKTRLVGYEGVRVPKVGPDARR